MQTAMGMGEIVRQRRLDPAAGQFAPRADQRRRRFGKNEGIAFLLKSLAQHRTAAMRRGRFGLDRQKLRIVPCRLAEHAPHYGGEDALQSALNAGKRLLEIDMRALGKVQMDFLHDMARRRLFIVVTYVCFHDDQQAMAAQITPENPVAL